MIRSITIGMMAWLLAGCMTAIPEARRGPQVAIDADFPDPAVLRAEDGTLSVLLWR